MTTFKELGLRPEIIASLDELGFISPSPIQAEAIPYILKSKKDLIALAQTGTGKTAAYSLPILDQLKVKDKGLQTIVLCPTRELCLQIYKDIKKFAKQLPEIGVTAVYGGERIDLQIRGLRQGSQIVVGTPGRVHDLIRRKALHLETIKWLVLDEADEMLDMGFKDDLDAILAQTPKDRQTLLFSATMSRSVHAIAKEYMKEAEEISIGEKNTGAANVSHEYYVVQSRDRFEALKRVLDSLPGVYGILFCRTRQEAQEVADKLRQAQYNTEALHGEIAQSSRTKIMDRFRRKQVNLLVATDVAARGIDVSDLSHVINYNMPDQTEAYTHRSGRTGRAQKSGVSISLIAPRDVRKIRELEIIIGKKFEYKKVPNGQEICRKQIDSFIEEVVETDISQADEEKYLSNSLEKLKRLTKEDLIKHFVWHKFRHLLAGYQQSDDLNAEAQPAGRIRPDEDHVYFKINLGKKHGLDVKGLFGLINANRNLKGVEIGRINLAAEYSIFSVERIRAAEVASHLQGRSFRGQKIKLAETAETLAPSRAKRGGFGRKFQKRRR